MMPHMGLGKKGSAIAFLNRKGGVGKTSCCYHLAGELSRKGYSLLLIDTDPQASLSQGLLGVKRTITLPESQTLAALFSDDREPDTKALIQDTAFRRLHIAPASPGLGKYNLPEPEKLAQHKFALRRWLEEVRDAFDYILIDCPPNLGVCSWTALLAANAVVIPVQPEDFGAQGILHVQLFLEEAQALNPNIRLLGYLLTMTRARLGIHAAYERQLRQLYGSQVFSHRLPDLKDFKEAVTVQTPVTLYKPSSPAAIATQNVATELVKRLSSLLKADRVHNETTKEQSRKKP